MGWGVALTQFFRNPLDHAIDVFQNLVVPETQNPMSLLLQPAGADRVILDLESVLPAVDLNNEFLFRAKEIDHVWSNGLLPPEPSVIDLAQAYAAPQCHFGIGRVAAKFSGVFICHADNVGMARRAGIPPP